jgi:predicted membrane channel-forming protein YqfA (hemolysin III family)
MNRPYLFVTSLLMLLPLTFLNKFHITIEETILAGFLLLSSSLSSAFWINPVPKSTIHYYDGIFAKISIILFSIYVLFIKEIDFEFRVAFVILLSIGLFMFYKSNKHSTKKWGSRKHTYYHVIFHIFIIYGSIIAFI